MFNEPTEKLSMMSSGVEIGEIDGLEIFENCQRKHLRRKATFCNLTEYERSQFPEKCQNSCFSELL